ncbi:uncharacterized protein C19orf44 homolog isoform X2 [Anguilla anguilla]|nr:uncharacterized protein C19orf44 homolog isoform X2 [Anguilla anguilla]
MWNHTGSWSSALERAQAQLSGRRFFNKSDNSPADELQEYMDALIKKKTALQVRRTYDDLSDISSDDRESEHNNPVTGIAEKRLLDSPTVRPRGGQGSRFLKKVPPKAVTSSQSPALSRAGVQKEEPRSVASSRQGSQSAALTRLALIEDRFKNRFQAREGPVTDAPDREDTPLTAQSHGELSVQGSRFLKKKSASVTRRQDPEPVKASRASAPQLSFSAKGVSLDSDEEDMKKLLGGPLDSSDESLAKKYELPVQETPPPVKKSYIKSSQKFTPEHPPFADRNPPSRTKSPSPTPPSRGSPRRSGIRRSPSYSLRNASMVLSPTPSPPNIPSLGRTVSPRVKFLRPSLSSVSVHSEIHSLDELFPDAPPSDDTISEQSETSEFKINIMSLDELVPDTLGAVKKPVEKKKTKEDSVKKTESPSLSLNVVLADDVLSEEEIQPAEDKMEYESDFESEIQTEEDHSVSEISEHLGRRDKEASTASEVWDGSRRAGESEKSVSYSSRSEFNRSDGSQSGSRRGSYLRSSASASLSDTITPPHERRKARQTAQEAGVQTQMDGLSYTWASGWAALGPSVGMSHVDPTPIASHIVSAEAVEALTAYSPAVLALNDMLRQQLALTRQIVEVSRHLHSSLLESLGPANYSYTTLEDTKEFIRRHKSPKLTVEEALEEVLQEMREYHYI